MPREAKQYQVFEPACTGRGEGLFPFPYGPIAEESMLDVPC